MGDNVTYNVDRSKFLKVGEGLEQKIEDGTYISKYYGIVQLDSESIDVISLIEIDSQKLTAKTVIYPEVITGSELKTEPITPQHIIDGLEACSISDFICDSVFEAAITHSCNNKIIMT